MLPHWPAGSILGAGVADVMFVYTRILTLTMSLSEVITANLYPNFDHSIITGLA